MFILFFIGSCIGSFVNVFIDRYMINKDYIFSRSECDHCHHQLSYIDLIPVFSYIVLKGKCRYCHNMISFRNVLLEIISGLLFIYCFVYHLYIEFIYIELLLIILFIDMKYMVIPDCLLIITFILSLNDLSHLKDKIIGSIIISILLVMMNMIKKDSFGGGDIKMYFVWGWILGTYKILQVFYISTLLTTLYCLISRYKSQYIAYGPFISIAIIYILLK